MNFILVPFLLAVRLPSNEERWKNGPEYVFNAEITRTLDSQQTDGLCGMNGLTTQLKCRPKEPDRLQCRYENTNITTPSRREGTVEEATPDPYADLANFDFGNVTFEIEFNERGIESYWFANDDRSKGDFLVDMYRLMANHLSLGTVLRNGETFESTENSTVGECLTDYVVKRETYNQTASVEFLLDPLSNFSVQADERLVITKRRRLESCIPHPVYSSATRYSRDDVLRESIEELQYSKSTMIISRSNFVSESRHLVFLYDSNRNPTGDLLDVIHLSLDSVNPANDKLKDIPNPISMGPIINTHENKSL